MVIELQQVHETAYKNVHASLAQIKRHREGTIKNVHQVAASISVQ